jgi:hypothetical protein
MTHCKKKKKSKHAPTTNEYEFTKRYDHYGHIVESSLKLGKQNTKTLSLVINRVKFKKKLLK